MDYYTQKKVKVNIFLWDESFFHKTSSWFIKDW